MADFTDVYKRYFRDVYHYAFSLCKNEALAEEITQETFFKALSSLESFDGKCKVSVWLCQIAKNTYISICRKEKHLDHETDTGLLVSNQDIEEKYSIVKHVENYKEKKPSYQLMDETVNKTSVYYKDADVKTADTDSQYKEELYNFFVEIAKKYQSKSVAE